MKKAAWICFALGVATIATFLRFDGPSRVSNWLHERRSSREYTRSERWSGDPAVIALAGKIVALKLERTPCYGPCPAYVFRVERSMRAFYEGEASAQRQGRFTGKCYSFDTLAYFAAARLLSLKDSYTFPVTDNPTTILTIEMTDGTKSISDYAHSGPNDLAIFCNAMDGVESSIEWTPEKSP